MVRMIFVAVFATGCWSIDSAAFVLAGQYEEATSEATLVNPGNAEAMAGSETAPTDVSRVVGPYLREHEQIIWGPRAAIVFDLTPENNDANDFLVGVVRACLFKHPLDHETRSEAGGVLTDDHTLLLLVPQATDVFGPGIIEKKPKKSMRSLLASSL